MKTIGFSLVMFICSVFTCTPSSAQEKQPDKKGVYFIIDQIPEY